MLTYTTFAGVNGAGKTSIKNEMAEHIGKIAGDCFLRFGILDFLLK